MICARWAAAFALLIVVTGCQPAKPEEEAQQPVAPDKVMTAKAKYAALPGALVGEVVDAKADETLRLYLVEASGIDAKALSKDDVISYIDPLDNKVVNHGRLHSSLKNGNVALTYEVAGEARAPRAGDLAVRLK